MATKSPRVAKSLYVYCITRDRGVAAIGSALFDFHLDCMYLVVVRRGALDSGWDKCVICRREGANDARKEVLAPLRIVCSMNRLET